MGNGYSGELISFLLIMFFLGPIGPDVLALAMMIAAVGFGDVA